MPVDEPFSPEEFSERSGIKKFQGMKTGISDVLWLLSKYPATNPVLGKVKIKGKTYYKRNVGQVLNNDSWYEQFTFEVHQLKSRTRIHVFCGSMKDFISGEKKEQKKNRLKDDSLVSIEVRVSSYVIIKKLAKKKGMSIPDFISDVVRRLDK